MKTNWLLLLFCSVLLLSSCGNDITGPRVRGTGPTESEVRPLNTFSRIDLRIDAEVILTQGSPQEVRVEAQRNILDVLETELTGEELQIEFGNMNVRDHEPIKVYVTVPSLTEVEVSGPGKIRSGAPLTTNSCEVNVSGSGSVDLNFAQVTGLRTNISGSGEAKLSGTAQNHNLNISGSGLASTYDLSTQDAYASIRGSGKGYVRVSRTLSTEISGSGTLYYKGTPTVSTRITGSGRVLADN